LALSLLHLATRSGSRSWTWHGFHTHWSIPWFHVSMGCLGLSVRI